MPRQLIYEWGELPHQMSPERFLEFQFELTRRQVFAEQDGNFIADRGIYDFMAYARDLADDSLIKKFDDYVKQVALGYDFIFYLPIEFDLKVDDVRKNSRQYQELIDRRLRQIYKDLNISYITITGSVQDRLTQIYQVLKIS